MSSDSDDADIPDGATCQKICEQFAAITGTDTACAQFYLQDRKWELQRAVNAYFDARKTETGVQLLNDGDEPEVVIKFESLAAAIAAATSQIEQPSRMKIISWNIDGLDENNRKSRTKFICNTINCELPDAVFLQEVVEDSLQIIKKNLPAYECLVGHEENYFTVSLLRKNIFTIDDKEIIEFPTSLMGRNMLIVKAKVGNIPFVLVNSHLESTRDHSIERISQLKTAFKFVLDVDDNKTVIFGGDMNLRDKEVDSCGGIPSGVEDLWLICGKRPECQYTWDTLRNDNVTFPGKFKPRLRFDRLYIRHSNPRQITPCHFGLVGLERLKSCRRFPSDHWGLIAYFDIP